MAMTSEVSFTFLLITYAISATLCVSAVIVGIITFKTRREVRTKHARDMKVLSTWESALEGLYSGNEADVVVALDKIWALSSPLTYSEVEPILNAFINHPNNTVALKARQILEKQDASLACIEPVPTRP